MISKPHLEFEPLIKVVVVGNGAVGKTSLIRRWCEGRFEQARAMTIGVDFQTRRVVLPGGAVKLSIWDVAGQDRFATVREGFYRGAKAAALVYDLSQPESVADLPRWLAEVQRREPSVDWLVVGNKCDLAQASAEAGAQFAAAHGKAQVLASALSGVGVEAMFTLLAELAHSH